MRVITHLVKEGGMMGSGEFFLNRKAYRYFVETIEANYRICYFKTKDLKRCLELTKKWEKFGSIMTTQYFFFQEMRLHG